MPRPRLNTQQVERLLAAAALDTRTLDQRIAAVQAELEDVPRRGHAEVTTNSGGTYTYDYILEADLMKAIRPLLAKHGVAVYYSDELVAQQAGASTVRVTMTLAAGGADRVLHADGYATDKGDKGPNKAKTAAVRYLLWKTFLQPSDEDPEQESVTEAEARGAHAARERDAEQHAAARAGTQTARTTAGDDDSKARLVQRIVALAIELDEVHGKPAGRSFGELQDAVQADREKPLHDLDANELVAIGQALASHVTTQREASERDGLDFTATGFRLPEPA